MKNKLTHKISKTFLILLCSTLKSKVVQYNSRHTGAGSKWTGKSYCLEEGEEVGDGGAEDGQQ